ncbi:MAG TPA: type II toxin-antitoxin system VapC family toxin [Chthoniobacterales bacterium]|nr:type II toxin-antitoxin system VapC family toxin [Chthoniobacterales bacterium]
MVGIDTNILVRFITQDDTKQVPLVNELLFTEEKVFLASIVLVETVWVLKRFYRWKREDVVMALETLLEVENLIFEDESSVAHATWAYRDHGDWADHFIQAQCKKHRCSSLITFDFHFAKFYPDFVKVLS